MDVKNLVNSPVMHEVRLVHNWD